MTPITVYTAYICIFDVIWIDKWKHLFVWYYYLHLGRVVPPAPGVLPHRVIGHLLLLEPVLQGVDHGPWNKRCLFLKDPPHCKKRVEGGRVKCTWVKTILYRMCLDTEQALLYWSIHYWGDLKPKTPLTKTCIQKMPKNKSMKWTSTDIVIMKVLKM